MKYNGMTQVKRMSKWEREQELPELVSEVNAMLDDFNNGNYDGEKVHTLGDMVRGLDGSYSIMWLINGEHADNFYFFRDGAGELQLELIRD